jgi:predicted peptidase
MRRALPSACTAVSLLALAGASCAPGHQVRQMAAAVDGHRYRYLLDVPPADEKPAAGWPLLLFLHGAGERGDDLGLVEVHGPAKLLDEFPELSRCVFVAPQCPAESWWRSAALSALLDEVMASEHVDASRVYVTGLSMGGYGAWNLLAHRPELFAAAVPICGGGEIGRLWKELETGFELAALLRAKDVPVRAYHGDADDVIPLGESRLLVRALREVGADVELTVYPGVEHDSWTRTYADPHVYEWLFAQRRDDKR